jgi:5-methylcytosine-specific restriction endonuclease McrA
MVCDHIIPLAKNGESTVRNLQLICKSCNTRKGPLDESDFMDLIDWVGKLKNETKEYVLRKLAKGGRY